MNKSRGQGQKQGHKSKGNPGIYNPRMHNNSEDQGTYLTLTACENGYALRYLENV